MLITLQIKQGSRIQHFPYHWDAYYQEPVKQIVTTLQLYYMLPDSKSQYQILLIIAIFWAIFWAFFPDRVKSFLR